MPQFDFANFVPQMAWLGLFFAILYFVVVRATLPKLGKVMEERDNKVVGDLAAAEAAARDSDAVSEAYQAELRKAQDAARGVLGDAKAEAQRRLEGQLAAAAAADQARIEAAQATLDGARGRAVAEIEAIAADVAASMVERVTGRMPAGADAAEAARAALARG